MDEAIRALPRASASPAFTPEVMRKVHWSGQPRSRIWRVAAVAAMVACLAVVLQVAVASRMRQQQKIDALRAEQQRIRAELNVVKRLADDTGPVVVLENDQGTRVIVDLDSTAQPAALKTYD